MRRAAPEVIYTTMGQSGLVDLALDNPYRWRGVEDWTPGDVRFREPPAKVHNPKGGPIGPDSTTRKEQRLTLFTAILASLGEPDPVTAQDRAVIEAGKRVGVGEKTAKSYRTVLKQRRRREEAQR